MKINIAAISFLLLLASCGDRTNSTSEINQDSLITRETAVDPAVSDPIVKDTLYSPADSTIPNSDTIHTAENSLDVEGKYTGMMPCASCDGITTVLELNEKKSFVLTEIYEGSREARTEINKGKWKIEENTLTLTSDKGGRQIKYKVEENQIRQLELAGQPIEKALAPKYILKKKA